VAFLLVVHTAVHTSAALLHFAATFLKVKRFCDPAENVPRRLGPGDSIRYALGNPRLIYGEEELRKARSFEVIYQGIIAPQVWNARRTHRFLTYTLKTSGTID
jgi:hypothetical protein